MACYEECERIGMRTKLEGELVCDGEWWVWGGEWVSPVGMCGEGQWGVLRGEVLCRGECKEN